MINDYIILQKHFIYF